MARQPWIADFTTNASLLKKAGVSNAEASGRDLTAAMAERRISFEVFSDDAPVAGLTLPFGGASRAAE